jgi:zinc and cadmium transporter
MDLNVWLYSLLSVFVVSLISLVGVFTFSMGEKLLSRFLLLMVSFSAGSLFGDAFFHLIPQSAEDGFKITIPVYLLTGLVLFFILEKFIHWRHCHVPTSKSHPHPVGMMNLVGDGFHNFIDGLVIGGAYLVSVPLGFATTLAVVFHEIPQEIGDFGVLLHAGFKKKKAVLLNFVSALTAVLGTVIALVIGSRIQGFSEFLIPFTAGGFIYIAGSDLIPEMHKEVAPSRSLLQLLAIIAGMVLMIALTLLE